MFTPDLTKTQLQGLIEGMTELEFARFCYCQEIAGAYLAVSLFEDMLISAMHMCDRVKLEKTLGADMDVWARSLAKQSLLQRSTLGSLIKILERHNIAEPDIRYLKWIKNKRDHFVHRLFHDSPWPGEIDEESCRLMCRRLLALQLLLSRAERNVWLIFERAGFIVLDRIEGGGMLAMNLGIFDASEEENPS